MKRIVSFLLVFVMLSSSLILTACDPIESIMSIFDKPDGTDNSENEIRTTVTKEEWKNVYKLTNHTIRLSFDGVILTVKAADTCVKMDLYMTGSGNTTTYYNLDNNTIIYKSSMGWIGYVSDSVPIIGSPKLEDLGYLPEISYDELVYDENSRSYTYEDNYSKVTLNFENGTLKDAHIISSDDEEIKIANVGTTVIELPAHMIINDGKPDNSTADPDAITTLTDDDLSKLLNMNNFTLKATLMTDMEMSVDIFIKVTDLGVEISAEALGVYEKQYYTVIDGEIHTIAEDNYGNYLAMNTGESIDELAESFAIVKDNISAKYIPYDMIGRYYKIESDEASFYFYFENGELTDLVAIIDSDIFDPSHILTRNDKIEVSFVLDDVGSTRFSFPEYRLIKNELDYKLNADGTGYIVTGIGGYLYYNGTDLIIPDMYRGLPVVEIGDRAFLLERSITSVVIPNSVERIGSQAFDACTELVSVEIGDSVKIIDEAAFVNCQSLKSINIGSSVTTIGSMAFGYCYDLETIVIPSSVVNVKYAVFDDCQSLTVYCEAEEKPEGWDEDWNNDNRPVEWGYAVE